MSGSPARRTVVRGAAWAAPTIVLGSAAPAWAASPVACPDIPALSSWTRTIAGTFVPGTGGDKRFSNAIRVDGDSQDGAVTVTFTTAIQMTAGTTYSLSPSVKWNYGQNKSDASAPQSARLTIGSQTLFDVTTQLAPLTAPGETQFPSTYTPTTTGAVTVTLTFIVSARGTRSFSDDITVTIPAFSSCTRG